MAIFKSITLDKVNINLWRQFKAAAVTRGLTLSVAFSEAVYDWIRKPKERSR